MTEKTKIPVIGKLYSPIEDTRENLEVIEKKLEVSHLKTNYNRSIAAWLFSKMPGEDKSLRCKTYFEIYVSDRGGDIVGLSCKCFSVFEKRPFMFFLGKVDDDYKFLFKDTVLYASLYHKVDFFDIFEER